MNHPSRKLRFEHLAAREMLAVVVDMPTDLDAKVGDTFSVPITMSDTDGLNSLFIELAYDTTVLDGISVAEGNLQPQLNLTSNIIDGSGIVYVSYYGTTECDPGEHVLANIVFEVASDAPVGSTAILDLQVVEATDKPGFNIDLAPISVPGIDPTDGVVTFLPVEPTIETNNTLLVGPGGRQAIDASFLEATDPDSAPNWLTYTIDTAPTRGSLIFEVPAILDGVDNDGDGQTDEMDEVAEIALGLGNTFRQSDINSGRIFYQDESGTAGSDSFDFTVTDNYGLDSDPAVFNIEVMICPTADAGSDLAVRSGSTVQLEGSGWFDPVGATEISQYLWDLDGDGLFGETGGDAARGDEVGRSPLYQAPIVSNAMSETVQLHVVDDNGVQSVNPSAIEITILPGSGNELSYLQSVVVKSPTPVNPVTGTAVGDTPEGEEWIDEWTSCYLELWVDPTSFTAGLTTFQTDVHVESDYYALGDPASIVTFGPAFTANQSVGTLGDPGFINGISAQVGSGAITGASPVLMARIQLDPLTGSAGVPLTSPSAHIRAVPVGQIWAGVSKATLDFADTSQEVGSAQLPPTRLWPVAYDLNDSGQIEIGDLSIFAASYGAVVGDSSDTMAGVADFNHSGSIEIGDLSLFAANFGKGPGNTVSHSLNFPAAWSTSPALMLAPTAPAVDHAGEDLANENLAPLAAYAVDTSELADAEIGFEIVDLPGDQLAAALDDVIVLDIDAAGRGWFVDATPWENSEFASSDLQALSGSDAFGRVDLLTVIRHELGHLAGRSHDAIGLMSPTLTVGTRRLDADADRVASSLNEDAHDSVFDLDFSS